MYYRNIKDEDDVACEDHMSIANSGIEAPNMLVGKYCIRQSMEIELIAQHRAREMRIPAYYGLRQNFRCQVFIYFFIELKAS
ncbi:hypothetical protein AVEN_165998-1 [Araneus ventricosus]|uniref:Uncharacterized protein n=1 Tax=Araneus ventricosus TaxID=182803 RepID=A0A4Y2RGV1_ARAVE|nr:hypothetical protein AVEN_165998-1 [Araneus ventricosus]